MGKIYSKSGDNGQTRLIGGKKVMKSDALVDIYGTLDELSAFIGLLFDNWLFLTKDKEDLIQIQKNLLKIESFYASEMDTSYDIDKSIIIELEHEIDMMISDDWTLKSFIIPGGNICSTYAHICRTVCRRAERLAVRLDQESNCLAYINRLSDYFFCISQL